MTIHVLVPYYNPEIEWLYNTMTNIFNQTHRDFFLWLLDDGSTNDCNKAWKVWENDSRLLYRRRYKNHGSPLWNMMQAVYEIDEPMAPCVQIDGDGDRMARKTLELFADAFRDPEVWVCGGKVRNNEREYPYNPYTTYSRLDGWCFMHPRAWRRFLMSKIPESDLMNPDTGTWWRYGNDTAYLWPMIELSGSDRVRFFDEVLYYHNWPTPRSMTRDAKSMAERDTFLATRQGQTPYCRLGSRDSSPRRRANFSDKMFVKRLSSSVTMAVNPYEEKKEKWGLKEKTDGT